MAQQHAHHHHHHHEHNHEGHSTILVIGGTGNVGQAVIKQLVQKKDLKILVGTRDPSAKKAEFPKGASHVHAVKLDLNSSESLDAALKGVQKVLLIQTNSPDSSVEGKLIVDAAKKAGVKHIVKLSALNITEKPNKYKLGDAHARTENYIKEAGIQLTSLRPASFCSNLPNFWSHTIKSQNTIYWNVKDDVKVNWVANDDIAAVAVAALTEPGHEGKIYPIGGDNLTIPELAKVISKVIGRDVKYVNVGDEGYRNTLQGFGLPPVMIDLMLDLTSFMSTGGYDDTASAETVKKVTGKPHQTVESFVTENAAAFK